MKAEFNHISCGNCYARPACSELAKKITRLEASSRRLGYAVTDGQIICNGWEMPEKSRFGRCGAGVVLPQLASPQEKTKIEQLASLEAQALELVTEAQEQAESAKHTS